MSRNRRKPKVVIPTNVDQLIATAIRVANAIGTSIIASMTNVAELSQRILSVAANARTHSDAASIAYETSQNFVRMRTEVCDVIKDRLIQIRDYAYATDGRTSPGMLGFEVVQTTSSDGRARVMIPANPDQFLALASRVNQSIATSTDPNLAAMSQGLSEQIEIATAHQASSIQLREQWQRELDRRQTSTTQLTVMLREVRDFAFAAAGPYRYETVSTTGLVVQSSATQGDGNGQPVENWTGDSMFTGGDADTNEAVNAIVETLGNGPYTEMQVCEAFPRVDGRKTIQCELAENFTGSFTKEQLYSVASQSPFNTGNAPVEIRLLADVALAWAELSGLTVQDIEPLNNDERLVTLAEAQAIIFENHGTNEGVAEAFNSVTDPGRVATLDRVVEAFLDCERERARVATANGTPTEETRTVDEVVEQVLTEFPEASRDQFFESDWLASSVAMSADPGINIGGQVATIQLAGGGVRIERTGGVNTGCAFLAYDQALATVVGTTDGGSIQFFNFPPAISDQVITDLPNGTHTLTDGSVITIDDLVVTEFVEVDISQGPEVLDVFVLAERFRSCLAASFDGVPTDVLSDGTPIGTVEEIANGIRQSAGIPADLIREEEFLGNLPFGELAEFCGQFAWNFVSSLGEPPTFQAELLIEGFMNARGDGVQLSVDDFNVQSGDQLTLEQWIEAVLSFDPVQFDRNNAIEIFMAARAEQTADAQQLIGALGFDDDGTLTCLLYTSPSPRDQRGSRMPSSA